MDKNDIMKMKYTDIKTVDKSELVDIAAIKINPADSPEKKMKDYVEQVKNPYCFLCNGYAVKLEFESNEKTMEDCFVNYINSLVQLIR